MAISNIVGTPLFPNSVGVGGLVDASEAAQYELNRTSTSYPAYAMYPVTNDANISSVTLLCHCNSLDSTAQAPRVGSVTGPMMDFVQATSASAGSINNVGLTSAQAKWGGLSVYCGANGTTGGYVRFVNTSNGFTLGTGDFTIELWWYMVVNNNNLAILDPRTTANQVIPLIYIDNSGSQHLRYFVSNADRITGTTTVSQNAWHHIALSRVSSNTRLYLDGTQEGSTFSDSNNYVAVTNWYFSGNVIASANGAGAAGYYQDIRITKGVGRYSGTTLTVPTAPFPDY